MYRVCKKICNECPFSKDSMKGWLGPHSIEELMDYIQFEYPFSCHKTRDDETTDIAIAAGDYPVCRGFVAAASKSFKLFGTTEAGRQMRLFQDQITPEEKEMVLSKWEFREHHTI